MPSLDISALASQCRLSPEAIIEVLENAQILFDQSETLISHITVGGTTSLPATSTMNISNENLHRTLKCVAFCSASTVVTVTSPVIVTGHSLFLDGVDLGQNGLFSGENGWNALFAASDDRVLPPICVPFTVAPSTTRTLVHRIDVNAAFTTGVASAKGAESRAMTIIGGL